MDELVRRREYSAEKMNQLQRQLQTAKTLAEGKACVYATGSFGRGEAGEHSDLDIFIVGGSSKEKDGSEKRHLNRLDEICIKANLIETCRQMEFPEFTGGGQYLVHYSIRDLAGTLGKPEDDSTNTFTARLLLLLESQCLIGDVVYAQAISDVVAAYWREYEDHSENFTPAFVCNDILRLWRTFCVNYEARTEREPEEKKAKGKIKNYKLKHSRLLTCYSGILYLLVVHELAGTVRPQDAIAMTRLTPTGRLDWLHKESSSADARSNIDRLSAQYQKFLIETNCPEAELIERFQDKTQAREYLRQAGEFGDTVFAVLDSLGRSQKFHRLLVI